MTKTLAMKLPAGWPCCQKTTTGRRLPLFMVSAERLSSHLFKRVCKGPPSSEGYRGESLDALLCRANELWFGRECDSLLQAHQPIALR